MIRENHIKVDALSCKDILKLCKWELGPAGTKVISSNNLLEVFEPVVEQVICLSEVLGCSFHFRPMQGSFEIVEIGFDSLFTICGNRWSIRQLRRRRGGEGLVSQVISAGESSAQS